MIFGNRAPRVPLDVAGKYRIAPNDPLPVLIAICVPDETGWGEVSGMHVLDLIRPGESADIKTASIVLTWKGPPREHAANVKYRVPLDKMRYEISTAMNVCKSIWATTIPLRLEAVPLTVDKILIDGRVLSVDLGSGEELHVDVDLASLEFERR